MTLTEPAAVAARSAPGPGASQGAARPVGGAVDPGAAALYAAAMPRGATPWHRHSHAFQGIYLKRSYVVLDAGLDTYAIAQVLGEHDEAIAKAPHNGASMWQCRCGVELGVVPGYVDGERSEELDALLRYHQASALRAWALGDAS
jgi:hypothetical protein